MKPTTYILGTLLSAALLVVAACDLDVQIDACAELSALCGFRPCPAAVSRCRQAASASVQSTCQSAVDSPDQWDGLCPAGGGGSGGGAGGTGATGGSGLTGGSMGCGPMGDMCVDPVFCCYYDDGDVACEDNRCCRIEGGYCLDSQECCPGLLCDVGAAECIVWL
jgi:hypothetical protein